MALGDIYYFNSDLIRSMWYLTVLPTAKLLAVLSHVFDECELIVEDKAL